MQERRQSIRGRTYLGARIVFNHRYSTTDCLVRDLSADGAKLTISAAVTVPAELDLEFGQSRETRRIRVVWRRGDELGVVFADRTAAAEVIPLDVHRKLKAAEAERDRLRAQLAAGPASA
jgi:hypothetical protein